MYDKFCQQLCTTVMLLTKRIDYLILKVKKIMKKKIDMNVKYFLADPFS